MKFIKVKNTDGKDVIINLLHITHFFAYSETETIIYMATHKYYVSINIPIRVLENNLNAIDDNSRNVWVL